MEFDPKVLDPKVLLLDVLNRGALLKADLSELEFESKDPNDLTSSLLSLLAPNTKVLAGDAGVDPPKDGAEDGVVATAALVFGGRGVSKPNTSLGADKSVNGFAEENPPKLNPPAAGFDKLELPKVKSFVFFTSSVLVGAKLTELSPNLKEGDSLTLGTVELSTGVALNAKEANPDPKFGVGAIFATSSTLASLGFSSALLTTGVVGLNVKEAVAVLPALGDKDAADGALKLKLGMLGAVTVDVNGAIDDVGG